MKKGVSIPSSNLSKTPTGCQGKGGGQPEVSVLIEIWLLCEDFIKLKLY